MKQESVWDIIIIGAGSAGLTAAIIAARQQKRVLLLDGKPRPGRKLVITGGGHCNISNRKVTEADYHSGELRTVRNVIRAFSSKAVQGFFEELGVSFIEEEDGKFLPEARSADAVLQALLSEVSRLGVQIEKLRKVTQIEAKGGQFFISGAGFAHVCRTVILATGGLSYPETGSDGSGYALARSLGHSTVFPTPALTPLHLHDSAWNSLAGITLPVELSLRVNGKKTAQAKGPLLFTHSGLSGPSILDLSRHWIRAEDRRDVRIVINFLPRKTTEQFLEELAEAAKEQPIMGVKRFLTWCFPERLAEILFYQSGVDSQLQLAHCSKADRQQLVDVIFSKALKIDGALSYEKAEATAGGVDMSEVDSKTLESKIHPGLYFAGEVLDVDGRIGGFNLHWAWASGAVAGRAATEKLASK